MMIGQALKPEKVLAFPEKGRYSRDRTPHFHASLLLILNLWLDNFIQEQMLLVFFYQQLETSNQFVRCVYI